MSTYAYLLISVTSLLLWMLLYSQVDKETKKEMIICGLIIIPIGILFQGLFWIKDWWMPSTITGTIIGIEDIIYGFTTPGFFVALPLALFGKKISIKQTHKNNTIGMLVLSFLCIALLFILFYGFHIHSFYSSLVSVVVPSLIIFILRKDLILFSLMSTFLCFFVPFIVFSIVNIFQTGFVYDIWQLNKLSGIVIFSTPLEDAIWYAASAMFCSVIYKYWRRGKVSYTF